MSHFHLKMMYRYWKGVKKNKSNKEETTFFKVVIESQNFVYTKWKHAKSDNMKLQCTLKGPTFSLSIRNRHHCAQICNLLVFLVKLVWMRTIMNS